MLSLRLRLSLVFVPVALVAILIVALLVHNTVRSDFHIYCANLCEMAHRSR